MSLLCKLVPERCIACGLCQIEAPDIFDYDEEGIVLFAQEPEAHQQFVMPYTKFSKLENKPGSVSLVP